MYQIKYQNGYEIVTQPGGNNVPSYVLNHQGTVVYRGTYQECVEWLQDRGIVVLHNRPA